MCAPLVWDVCALSVVVMLCLHGEVRHKQSSSSSREMCCRTVLCGDGGDACWTAAVGMKTAALIRCAPAPSLLTPRSKPVLPPRSSPLPRLLPAQAL